MTLRSISLAVVVALSSLPLMACSGPPRYVAGRGIWDEPAAPDSRATTTRSGAGERAWSDVYSDLLGVPYRPGGTTPRGFDCSGLVCYMYHEYDGSELPRTASDMFARGQSISRQDLRPGDLVFYETSGRGPSHVGIYLGARRFVHASTSVGVTVSSMDERYYRDRYLGARRLRN